MLFFSHSFDFNHLGNWLELFKHELLVSIFHRKFPRVEFSENGTEDYLDLVHITHFTDNQGRDSGEVIAPLLHNNSARLEICYLGNNFHLLLRLQSNKWLLSGSLKFTQHIYVTIFFLLCILMYKLNHYDCITFTLNLFSYCPIF